MRDRRREDGPKDTNYDRVQGPSVGSTHKVVENPGTTHESRHRVLVPVSDLVRENILRYEGYGGTGS